MDDQSTREIYDAEIGDKAGTMTVEQIIALAVSDGEFLGRHASNMKPADVIAIREKVTAVRVQQANDLHKSDKR